MPATFRIFMSAGEASGDAYGALLAETLRERLGSVTLAGCGGERMRAAGCETWVDARDITMVGLLEVIPGLPRAWQAFRHVVNRLRRQPPDLAILIDFPDFNLRLAKQLKRAGVPVLYFVAPQVWAWRRRRLAAIRRYVDRLLCIFPFEESFFRAEGVNAEFIGHPLVGRVAPRSTAEQFRSQLGIPRRLPLVALLPGSRRKEIQLNLPPMLQAAQIIARWGNFGFVIPAASTMAADWIRGLTAPLPLRLFVAEDCAYDALAHSQAAVVASGTAAIETALLGTPMVIVYRVSPATWWLGHRLVRVPFYSMVNIVAERQIVPELIQDQFQPEAVAREVRQLLEVPETRNQMRQELRQIAERLRPPARWVLTGRPPPPGEPAAPAVPQQDFAGPIQRAVAVAESILTTERAAATDLAAPGGIG